jgi:flagellar biosynthesis protein FlhF
MRAALAQVKQELGPEAVILNTKTFYQGGIFGFGKKEMVEIMASNDINIVDMPPSFARRRDAYAHHQAGKQDPDAPWHKSAASEAPAGEILKELVFLKSHVDLLTRESAQAPDYPPALSDHYRNLLESGVSRPLAKKTANTVHTDLNGKDLDNRNLVKKRIEEELGKLIKLSGPIACDGKKARKIVMTGPTGVGKTTTIAKLAAQFSINEKQKVGLVTADTYRIAAVEQLKVYADIIGVALDVVLTPKELREAVRRHSDKDIIFIDTAGRSQQDATRLTELKGFIESAEPDENHLLISSTTDTDEVFNIIEKFSIVDVSSFIFSKIDECRKPGLIFNVLSNCEKPVSYITTGQDVPEDIEVATEPGLLNLLFRDGKK